MKPNSLRPTVAQAKAAWEAQPKPSLNNVLAALHAAGFTGMAKATLQRWHTKGWPDPTRVQPEVTVEAKKVVAEVIDNAAAEPKPDADAVMEAELKKLADLALPELARLATQEGLIAQIMLAKRIQRRAHQLVQFAPKDAAKLIEALKGPTSNVTVVMPGQPDEKPQPVGGKMIEHDANERPMTALQSSIREFRAQQGMKVVK